MPKLLAALGGFCVLFGLIPPVGYGVFNLGVLSMVAAGGLLLLAARFWRRLDRRPRRAVLAVLGLGAAYVVGMSAWMAGAAFLNRPPEEEPVAVVVLGAKVNGSTPSLMLRHRLEAAVAYLNEHPLSICVVSGGQGADEIMPEAQAMAAYLEGRGIAPERILTESASTNTRENLALSAALLEERGFDGPVAVITDSFHQLRASIFARPLELDCYAVSSVSPWGLFPSYWVRELVAVPVALIQTYESKSGG